MAFVQYVGYYLKVFNASRLYNNVRRGAADRAPTGAPATPVHLLTSGEAKPQSEQIYQRISSASA